MLRNSDVKGEACGKGKGAVEKAPDFRSSAQGWEHAAAAFQPRHGLDFKRFFVP